MSTAPEVPPETYDEEIEPAFSDMSWEGPQTLQAPDSDESRAIETPKSEIAVPHRLSRHKTLLNAATIATLWQENKRYNQWPGKGGLVVVSNVVVMAAEVFTIIEHRLGVESRSDYDNIEAITLYVDSLISSYQFNREILRNYAKDAINASLKSQNPTVNVSLTLNPKSHTETLQPITLGVSLSKESIDKLSNIPGVSHVSDEKDGNISVYITDARARRRIPPRIEGKSISIKNGKYPLDNDGLSEKSMNRLLSIKGVTSVGYSENGEKVIVYINERDADTRIPNMIENFKVETVLRPKEEEYQPILA
jgi:hypothetical protein